MLVRNSSAMLAAMIASEAKLEDYDFMLMERFGASPCFRPVIATAMRKEGYCWTAILEILDLINHEWEMVEGVFPLHLNAHRSQDFENDVAYTLPTTVAPFYKCVKTRPGKFFKKHMDWLTDAEIQQLVNEFSVRQLDFEFHAILGNIPNDKCVRIYTNPAPGNFYSANAELPSCEGSCMAKTCYGMVGSHDQHPVMAYENSPDVGIVWSVDNEGRTASRAMLNIPKKTVCRVYVSGPSEEYQKNLRQQLLLFMSQSHGFLPNAKNGLESCRLSLIESTEDSRYVLAPYLDGIKNARVDGDWTVVGDGGEMHLDAHEEGAVRIDGRICQCRNCGDEIDEDNCWNSEHGDSYCESCYHDIFISCCSCDSEIRTDDACCFDGDYFCQDCFVERYTSCEKCGNTVSIDDTTTLSDTGLLCCERCRDEISTQCNNCSEYFRRRHSMVQAEDNNYYCEGCAGDVLYRCEKCGLYFIDEDEANVCCADLKSESEAQA